MYVNFAVVKVWHFSFFFCSNIATEDMLYTESDLEKSMDKIETIHFHQVYLHVYSCLLYN